MSTYCGVWYSRGSYDHSFSGGAIHLSRSSPYSLSTRCIGYSRFFGYYGRRAQRWNGLRRVLRRTPSLKHLQ